MTKKVLVSGADYGAAIARAAAGEAPEGKDSREARAAKALGVELLGLARERPLSRTWRVRSGLDGPTVAMVVVADEATAFERDLFARMAEDIHAAGDALPGVLRARTVTPARDAFLTDLWTAGSARDLAVLKWSARQRVEFVLGAVRTLDGLHALGLVHGCLCPANVLLDDELKPVIAEAGSVPVREVIERGQDAAVYASFAAPEVTQGGKVDVRSDVYSVGRILEDAMKGVDSPPALGEIIGRCVAAAPAERYQGAAELVSALEAVVGTLSDTQEASPAPVVAPAPARPAERDRAARAEAPTSTQFAKEGPSLAWMPPRALGIGGGVAFAGALAASALIGGTNDALRALTGLAAIVGAALVTTLLRPSATATRARGLTTQLALAAGAAALVFVLDPLSLGYRMAAQRHVRGDTASRRAAIAEVLRLGRDFRGLSLANADLTGEDLSGADLRGVDLSNANLTHARLYGAEVQGASFDGANLAGAMLDQVELALATAVGATCDGETRLPHGWRCTAGHVGRSPAP